MQRVIDLQSGVVLFSAIVFSSLASDGSGKYPKPGRVRVSGFGSAGRGKNGFKAS